MSPRARHEAAITVTAAMGKVPERLVDVVSTMMRISHVPGLSLAVVNADRLLFAGGFGAANLASGTLAMPETSYLWFSMSKIVTATAAMKLAADGQLDLDAPAAEYVDYLRAPGPRQPTVRQLLNHTAGLGNPVPLRWARLADVGAPEPELFLRRLMGRRRAYRYPVGGTAHYSNVGYLAVGQVIASAAGRPFEQYVREVILDPVGMSRTGFSYLPGAEAATGYVRSPRLADPFMRRLLPAGVVGERREGYLALNRFYVDGPAFGGLVGDVLDAGRFLRMHLGDGELDGRRILDASSIRSMRQLDCPGKPFDHGIGWFRRPTTGSGDWVEHFGAGAGFWNVMRLYPHRGLAFVMMANSTKTYDFEPVFELLAGQAWTQ
ncbi:MAG TPA: serine hydrolase domain-containing protein [Actinomycetes bacterium]|nr:serine hydrolase domain-containing protein [Actinomycetes bacterium]